MDLIFRDLCVLFIQLELWVFLSATQSQAFLWMVKPQAAPVLLRKIYVINSWGTAQLPYKKNLIKNLI